MKLRIFALGIALFAPAAFAEDAPPRAPTVDFTTPLLDENDAPAKDTQSPLAIRNAEGIVIDCGHCPTLTIGTEVNRALAQYTATTAGMAADDKAAYQGLGMRVKNDSAAVLTPEEISAIKLAVGKFPGLVVLRIFPAVQPGWKPPPVAVK
jgi:hypothetical protein